MWGAANVSNRLSSVEQINQTLRSAIRVCRAMQAHKYAEKAVSKAKDAYAEAMAVAEEAATNQAG